MTIVVYCSSRDNLDEKYQQLAAALGQWIGQNGHTLLYGGSNAGLMHVTAAAVHEAGGRIIGVIPEIFRHRIDPLCDEVVYTDNLGDRKQHMIKHGDVFVVLPGGIGTLDEWISTLAVMTIGDDDRRPVIVADLDNMYAHTIQQINTIEHTPFARDKRLSITTITHTTTQLLDQLSKNTQQ